MVRKIKGCHFDNPYSSYSNLTIYSLECDAIETFLKVGKMQFFINFWLDKCNIC